ncbi:MAG: serine hydrolase [Anaerolineae bacterium]
MTPTKALSGAAHAAPDRLPYSTPEAQGIPSSAVDTFVSALDKLDSIHSFMLLRHGHVVAEGWWEPYRPQDPHVLFSLSKSFTSTAIGLLVAEGRLTVHDPVLKFFHEEAPAKPSANLQAMQVRHLLSMNTGHETEPFVLSARTEGKTWVKRFLEHPVKHKPGTHFLYNSIATYMLSAIVTKLTGERLIDYLRPRLFEPLGIKNPVWEQSPQGINTGGWGLNITTPDIAVFGQLYLQKGLWNGKRLVPEAWIAEASAFQSDNGPANESDWTQGYGYQFWRCRHNAYRGDGAFGQYCVIMPDQDAVLVITGGLDDMQMPLTALWDHLLPVMSAAP